ncbi:hypothetical protein MD484_g1362, partial [Candolleomyces efflorescens]
MPRIRPGWNPKQSVYLRIAAIELLSVGHTGSTGREYLEMFLDEWIMAYGIPEMEEGVDFDAALALYKARVITTVKWHAFGGHQSLKVSASRRIGTLKRQLQRDLYYLWDVPNRVPDRVAKIAPQVFSKSPSATDAVRLDFVAMKL